VWCTDKGWLERAREAKYATTIASMAEHGWSAGKPATIGIGSNGFVTLLDGNHRVCLILANGLVGKIPLVAVKFHFFDIGNVINPLQPGRQWDGKNLFFICFPRGTCGKCGPCSNAIPEARRLLCDAGIAR
jgi:hypothetical protein